MSQKITDDIANSILHEAINFKLSIAHHHLEKIPNRMEQDFNKEHFLYEAHVSSFLLFCNMAIDSLCYQIASFLGYDVDNETISIYTIKRDLENSQTTNNQNLLLTIKKYFEYPKKIEENSSDKELEFFRNNDHFSSSTNYIISIHHEGSNYFKKGWDLQNSMLWLMRELRNTVTHKSLLGRALVLGTQNPVMMLIFARWPKPNSVNTISRGYRNPAILCEKFYEELELFVDETLKIIGQTNSASQYRNQLNFEL